MSDLEQFYNHNTLQCTCTSFVCLFFFSIIIFFIFVQRKRNILYIKTLLFKTGRCCEKENNGDWTLIYRTIVFFVTIFIFCLCTDYLIDIFNIYANYKIVPTFVWGKFRLYGNLLFVSEGLYAICFFRNMSKLENMSEVNFDE